MIMIIDADTLFSLSFDDSSAQTDEAFKKTFQFLQYFAVGVEQILMDIILHDGKMWSDMKRVENQLYQIICEVRLGMYLRGVSHAVRDAEAGSRQQQPAQTLIVIMIFLFVFDSHSYCSYLLLGNKNSRSIPGIAQIEPDRDVMHSAMSHEFRDIDNASRRNTRDYLILRDYIRAVQFIMEMFRHLKLQRMNQPKL